MRYFTIHLKDKDGNRVDYMTGAEKCQKLIDKYSMVVDFLAEKGFTQVKQENAPQATTEPQGTKHCGSCGEQMEFKQGTSKTGKPWKGWFCKIREHDPIWEK